MVSALAIYRLVSSRLGFADCQGGLEYSSVLLASQLRLARSVPRCCDPQVEEEG